MNKSPKSSLKAYDKDVDTRSLYHTTIGIFMTRGPGDLSKCLDGYCNLKQYQTTAYHQCLGHLGRLRSYWGQTCITPVMHNYISISLHKQKQN